ncbi:Forkhead box protein [Trichinella spiralis]|uniref:Forkhead box protein n=1 Tax=Trichinella spiralis TaxID=6334 RepID=A0ABR3KE65_TRISP
MGGSRDEQSRPTNSIRHNLSLHSRFMRIQNEGPGKSSWWVIDPDAKPGKSSRRRAGSMEISKKLEKKRGRVRKKMEELRTVNGVNTSDPAMSTLSPSSESSDLFDSGSMMPFNLSPANDFRNRSNSAVSSYSVGAAGPCLSPKFESRFDDWQDDVPCSTDPSYPSDLLESMSHSMSLTEPPPYPSAQAAQSFIYGEEEPTSTSRLHNGSGSGAATKYMVVSQQQQQQQRGRPIANAFSVKGATSQQLTTASNGQVVYQQQQQQHMKSEPPPYRDMYSPAVSTASQARRRQSVKIVRISYTYGCAGIRARRMYSKKKMPKKTPLLPSRSCPTESFRTFAEASGNVPNKTPPHSQHTD